MKHRIKIAAALAASGMAAAASPAYAVSYASGVRNTGGANWEFVLNEPAAAVTITRNGGSPLTLNALAAGRHTFDMTGFTNFEIQVETSTPVGWTTISDTNNLFTNYERPVGLVVNNIPTSPYFGTIYVANPRTTATGGATPRTMGDGVYAMTADQIGVNLSTREAIAEPNDVSLATVPPGWNVGPLGTDLGNGSVWRLSMDDAGNLIASDWSNANGGIKYASPDLTSGGALLLHQDGTVINDGADEVNFPDGLGLLTNGSGEEVHGSIVSRPYVTGTLGQDLVVYAMDEDRSPKGVLAQLDGHGNSIWKWNVGAVVGNFDQTPQLIIDVDNIPDPDLSSQPPLPAGSTKRENFMSLDVGVLADAVYSPATNKWYLVENRNDGLQAGLIVITPDGGSGSTPTLEWSSLQFSIDNGLDGFTDTLNPDGTPVLNNAGIQDIFRQIKSVELSPDGKSLLLSRPGNYGSVLNTANGVPGGILILPLDAAGLPDLDVADGKVTNISSIELLARGAPNSGTMAFDAAGNLYTTSNISERVQIFSPGGSWLATTTSAGGFTLTEVGGGLDGDFNGDDVVDGADFLLWQRGGSPNPLSSTDLDLWKANFGQTAAAAAVGSVPEPSAGLLATGAFAALGFLKRRR